MSNIYKVLWPFLVITLFISCSDDDPELPRSEPEFVTDPAIVEVGVEVMFDNLTKNASRYEWNFGDGQESSETSPVHTYQEAGVFTVTLTAFTNDNQMDSVSQQVTVRERVFTGYVINVFPNTNGGAAWDPDSPDSTQFADLLVQLLPMDTNNPDGFLDGIFGEVAAPPIGNVVDQNAFRMVLTDDNWTLVLFDFDGEDPGNITNDDVEVIIGVQFNPVQAITFKNNAGDGGFISVIFVDNNTGNILDVDITFVLE